ncbi:MAG: hypothetical protein JRJ82_16435 [Deltaproteobacteria bacterium]|nr:hypothetical protein [Deltaproteobacteria bacterium]
MLQNISKYLTGFILTMVMLNACASTELTESWVDERYQGKPVSDILVIGVTDEKTIRRAFESKFVRRFKALGVDAVSSANAISTNELMKLDKAVILQAAHKYNSDSVLITRLMGVDEKTVYHRPAHYGGFYGYYGHYHGYMHSSAYQTSQTFYRLETVLYDVKTEKPIWSILSRTWDRDSARQIIDEVIDVAIKDMRKKKVIP